MGQFFRVLNRTTNEISHRLSAKQVVSEVASQIIRMGEYLSFEVLNDQDGGFVTSELTFGKNAETERLWVEFKGARHE